MTFFSSLLLFFVIVSTGFDGVTIERLEIPLALRNGSGPVDFICVYNVGEIENGLVVKWYLNEDQIYMWIPPMEPRDSGVIGGLASRNSEMISRPQSHSIIRLSEVTLDMSGEYICSVSTFVSQDFSRATMTVYEREEILDLRMFDLNATHVNVYCSAIGARPPPILKILVESKTLENLSIDDDYPNRAKISSSKIIEKPEKAALMECEIVIPGTGYGYRETRTYWPHGGGQRGSINALRLTSTAVSIYRTDLLFVTMLVVCRSNL